MASLYIKDSEAADKVRSIARRLGTTQTEAVRRGMAALEEQLGPEPDKPDWLEWMKAYRRDHPLPPPTGIKADKAFFDELWGEDPD